MNLQQQQQMLSNVLHQVSRANAAVDRAEPVITAAALRIGRIVEALPDGLLREQAWKAAKPEVLRILSEMSTTLGQSVFLELAHASAEQMDWALRYLAADEAAPGLASFSADAPGAAAARRAEAAATGANPAFMPRTVEAFEGAAFTLKDLGYAGADPNLLGRLQLRVPPDVAKLVMKARYDRKSLTDWFGDSAGPQGVGGNARATLPDGRNVPRYARFSYENLDRNIRSAWLAGATNEEAARNIISTEIRGKARLGTNAVRLKSDARALSRTLMADLSDRAHIDQWREMERQTGRSIIRSWRLDASTDTRACQQCSFWDGQTWDDRSDAPSVPLHVNCVLGDTPVGLGSLAAATRARYRGDVVTLRTQSGRQVTVTAQHPMLTTRGWVPAIELGQGDHLVSQGGGFPLTDGLAGVALPNLDHKPATAEQVFHALRSAFPVRSVTVPAASVQFHGDGAACDGDVEVVWANRELQGEFDAALGEGFGQIPLVGGVKGSISPEALEAGLSGFDQLGLAANAAASGLVGFLDQSLALLRGELGHADAVRLAAAAQLEPHLLEPFLHGPSTDAEVLGHGLHAGSLVEQSGDLCLRHQARSLPSPNQSNGFSTGTQWNTGLLEPELGRLVGDSEVGGDRLDALAGLVKLDQLVSIEVSSCRHNPVWVYDFTTLSSTYTAASLITHNCRCQLLPETATTKALREREGGRERVTAVELTDQKPPAQKPGQTRAQYRAELRDRGWFISQGRGPSGERWYRKRVERSGESVTDWLGSLATATTNKRSAAVSLQEAMGGSARRAEYFSRLVNKGVPPRQALDQLIRKVNGDKFDRSWIPIKDLPGVDDIPQQKKIPSPRQRRAIAAGRPAGPPRRGY